MKKTGILNRDISYVTAGMGHTDTLTIADAGLPIPDGPVRIDLAVKEGVPSFLDVLEAVLSELKVQKMTLASEIALKSPALYDKVRLLANGVEIELIPHEELKQKTRDCMAVIRTGEFTSYANIILESGVVF